MFKNTYYAWISCCNGRFSSYPAFAAVNTSLSVLQWKTVALIFLSGVLLTAETEIILRFWWAETLSQRAM